MGDVFASVESRPKRTQGGICGQTIEAMMRSTMCQITEYELDILREEIYRLTAELTALRAGQDALVAAAYEAAADHAGGAWFFNFPTDDRKEPYRNAARAIHALTPADATAALDSMLRAERDKALRDAAGALCEWGEDAPQSGQFFAEAILAMIETEDQTNDR